MYWRPALPDVKLIIRVIRETLCAKLRHSPWKNAIQIAERGNEVTKRPIWRDRSLSPAIGRSYVKHKITLKLSTAVNVTPLTRTLHMWTLHAHRIVDSSSRAHSCQSCQSCHSCHVRQFARIRTAGAFASSLSFFWQVNTSFLDTKWRKQTTKSDLGFIWIYLTAEETRVCLVREKVEELRKKRNASHSCCFFRGILLSNRFSSRASRSLSIRASPVGNNMLSSDSELHNLSRNMLMSWHV